MQKVPIPEVIRFSYIFFFKEFGTILRLTWFPALIIAVATYLSGKYQIDVQFWRGWGTVGTRDYLEAVGIGHQVLTGVALVMMAVALHRVILFNDRRPGTYFLFSLKRTEWLFIALGVLFYVAVYAVGAVFLLVGTASGAIEAAPAWTEMMVSLLFVTGLYIYVRLWPLYPVIVVEKRLDFRRALTLSEGNFWRLWGVNALGILPPGLILVFVLLFTSGTIQYSAFTSGEPAGRDMVYQVFNLANLVFAVLSFPVVIVAAGLGVPLLCYSYKALRNIGADEYLDEATGELQLVAIFGETPESEPGTPARD